MSHKEWIDNGFPLSLGGEGEGGAWPGGRSGLQAPVQQFMLCPWRELLKIGKWFHMLGVPSSEPSKHIALWTVWLQTGSAFPCLHPNNAPLPASVEIHSSTQPLGLVHPTRLASQHTISTSSVSVPLKADCPPTGGVFPAHGVQLSQVLVDVIFNKVISGAPTRGVVVMQWGRSHDWFGSHTFYTMSRIPYTQVVDEKQTHKSQATLLWTGMPSLGSF